MHNYNQLVGSYPEWTAEDNELTHQITIIPWVELCYKFSKMVHDYKLAQHNTVSSMIRVYSEGKIPLSDIQPTDDVEYDGFTISTSRQYRESFVRELPRSDYYNEGTLLDNGPYQKAEVYYLLKDGKVISREIVLDNKNRARRVTQYPKAMRKQDVQLFMESALAFLQYLIEKKGYESVYRLLPKSADGTYDPCMGEIGIKYSYTDLFYIQDLSTTSCKVIFPHKKNTLSKEDKLDLIATLR